MTDEFRKQISIFLPVSDWRALRGAAAREGIPITELCRRWLRPHLEDLRQEDRSDERGIAANHPTREPHSRPTSRRGTNSRR